MSQTDKQYHARGMTWAQRLKRVFNIDIAECEKCKKHNVTIISCITQPAIIYKILLYWYKQGSPIIGNNTRAPPVEALEQTLMCVDFTIQRDFDFGAWHTRNTMMLEHVICWGKGLRGSLSRFQCQRSACLLTSTTNISLISSTPQRSNHKPILKCSWHRG